MMLKEIRAYKEISKRFLIIFVLKKSNFVGYFVGYFEVQLLFIGFRGSVPVYAWLFQYFYCILNEFTQGFTNSEYRRGNSEVPSWVYKFFHVVFGKIFPIRELLFSSYTEAKRLTGHYFNKCIFPTFINAMMNKKFFTKAKSSKIWLKVKIIDINQRTKLQIIKYYL